MSFQTSKVLFSGISWTSLQTLVTKIISIVTQLILAAILLPEDFGKFGIVTSITSITFLIQGFGLAEVLINRQKSYSLIYNLAKSFALSSAVCAFVITNLTSVIVGIYVFNDFEIIFLIMILSLSIPFNSISIVTESKLRINLEFRKLTYIRIYEFLVLNVTLLTLVYSGLGVYSFAIAPLISSGFRYFLLHKYTGLPHYFLFRLNHYKYLLRDSYFSFLNNLFQSIIRYTDYLIIGIYVSIQSVGIYFMGYSLSVQVISLLVLSLSPVFYPVLSKIDIQNKLEFKDIFIKIITVFSLFGMCFSMIQLTMVEPLIKLFMNDNWLEAIVIVQILSLGIGFNVSSTVWTVGYRLRGDFKNLALMSFFAMITFLVIINFSTYFYGIIGTATGVSLYYLFVNTFLLCFSLKKFNIRPNLILKIIFKYFIISVIIFYCFHLVSEYFTTNLFYRLLLKTLMPTLFYFFILYQFDKKSKNALTQIKQKLWKKK